MFGKGTKIFTEKLCVLCAALWLLHRQCENICPYAMPRLTPLPKRLRYLQPFRKQVANLKPEEIDESMDLSLLNELLCQRIHGFSLEEGKKLLQDDQAVLKEWLSTPDLEDNGGMGFLHGYFMGLPELIDHLLEEKNKPPQRDEIRMELPVEAKIKKRLDHGVWEVSWLQAKLWISPADQHSIENEVRGFLELARTPFVDVVVLPVAFGNVGGVKKVTREPYSKSPEFDYALQVPGGYVTIGLLKPGQGLDESRFEQYFHAIRIVRGSDGFLSNL